jgi:hypothetical protein
MKRETTFSVFSAVRKKPIRFRWWNPRCQTPAPILRHFITLQNIAIRFTWRRRRFLEWRNNSQLHTYLGTCLATSEMTHSGHSLHIPIQSKKYFLIAFFLSIFYHGNLNKSTGHSRVCFRTGFQLNLAFVNFLPSNFILKEISSKWNRSFISGINQPFGTTSKFLKQIALLSHCNTS